MSWNPSGVQPYPQTPQYGAGYGYPGAPGPVPGLLYARFWRRFGGYLLDGLLLAIPTLAIEIPLLWGPFIDALKNSAFTDASGVAHVRSIQIVDAVSTSTLATLSIGSAVLSALYFGVLVSAWGKTVGQAAVGVRVVRQEDLSQRLPLERALLRAFPFWGGSLLAFVPLLSLASGLLVLLTLLWVAWDPYKQGLHDKLARSVVVRNDPNPVVPPYGYGYAAHPQIPPPGYAIYPGSGPAPGYGPPSGTGGPQQPGTQPPFTPPAS